MDKDRIVLWILGGVALLALLTAGGLALLSKPVPDVMLNIPTAVVTLLAPSPLARSGESGEE